MRTFSRSFVIATMLLPLAAWSAANERLTLDTQSRLWIEGTSTIRSFSCKANDVNAAVDARSGGAIQQLLAGEKAVVATEVSVAAGKIDCGNGTMNEHMLKALKADDNPTILFRLSSYDVAKGADQVTGTLRGILSLGGMQKPFVIMADGKADGDMMRITGSTDVKMTDFDLKPPSLMFGRIKVGETVKVKFDLLFKN